VKNVTQISIPVDEKKKVPALSGDEGESEKRDFAGVRIHQGEERHLPQGKRKKKGRKKRALRGKKKKKGEQDDRFLEERRMAMKGGKKKGGKGHIAPCNAKEKKKEKKGNYLCPRKKRGISSLSRGEEKRGRGPCSKKKRGRSKERP